MGIRRAANSVPDGHHLVSARASCRADLAGGTIDLWPLYLFHPGAVTLNFALNIFTTCRIESLIGHSIILRSLDTHIEERYVDLEQLFRARAPRHAIGARLAQYFRPSGGFLLETNSYSPAGAGISGSSALMIAAAAALARFTGRRLNREPMRALAQNVEAQIIGVPTGCQDYYPALYGGISAIHLGVEGVHREALKVDPAQIEAQFLLAYTGAPRASGINNWEVFKRHIDGDRKVSRNFEQIAGIAVAMRTALLSSAWDQVAQLLRAEWKLRRANYPGISTPFIDKLIRVARRNGGSAAKVCGAGGGGCVLFMVAPERKGRVANALSAAGARVLPFQVARNGLIVQSAKLS